MPRYRWSSLSLALALLLAAGGCAVPRHEVRTPALSAGGRGVIFAIDGAGGFEATSAALARVVQDTGLPLAVETFEWSHGYRRFLADQIDWSHARVEAERLAGKVSARRQSRPDGEIYLVGHSAGSAFVLAAAEALPAQAVDRIILLAPSVSADYDLRPALSAARSGIDVFYSRRDRGYLGLGVALIGTSDRRWWCPAAGRVGFRPQGETAEDVARYAKLRQHAWDPCVEWTGNHGGHYGGYQPRYLRAYVLPLLCRTAQMGRPG